MKKNVVILIAAALLLVAAVLLCVFVVFPGGGKLTQAPLPDYWPEGEWRASTPEQQGMDSDLLADMINSIKESGKNINSVTVIRNGYLVSETYFYPYQKGVKHAMNSCTKSFLSAVVGAEIEQGSLKLDDKVMGCFSDTDIANVDSRKAAMTVQNLLDMTTGLDWSMEANSSTNAMTASADWAKYTLDLPMAGEPGAAFSYCNGAACITSSIVQSTAGKNAEQLFTEHFAALGIKDYYWGVTPEGTNIGYSGIFINPDDAAKLGYLYLQKGSWNGEQLVPENWVEQSTKQQAKAGWGDYFPGYGYMWWITDLGGYSGYAAMGYGGDYIFVVPDANLVVVFTAGMFNDTDLFYPAELMDKFVVPSVKSNAPIQGSSDALKQATDAVQNAPAPVPVPLPEIASRIDGKTYDMSDMGILVFHFDKDGTGFTFDLASGTFNAGLDGTYRLTDTGSNGTLPDHNIVAAAGNWTSDDTLVLDMRSLGDGYITKYTLHFDGDNIDVTATSNIYGDQSFSGKMK